MRRLHIVLAVVAFALVGLVGLLVGPAVRAQDATPAANSDVPALLQAWLDGINAGDGAAVAALYATNGTHEDVPSDMVAEGQEQIAGLIDGIVGQLGDYRIAAVSGHQAGDLAVLEYTTDATDLESGNPLHLRGIIVFELDQDGLIRRSADYYDVATILAQLGMLDMGQMGEATPTP